MKNSHITPTLIKQFKTIFENPSISEFQKRKKYLELVRITTGLKRSQATETVAAIKWIIDNEELIKDLQVGKDAAILVDSANGKILDYQGEEIKNIDDLIRQFNIPLTDWAIKNPTINTSSAAVYRDGQYITVPRYAVRCTLVPRNEKLITNQILDEYKKSLLALPAPEFKKVKLPSGKRENVYVISIADLHHGKLAHAEETGGDNYDSKISKELFMNAVYDLVDNIDVTTVEKIIFPIGNDFFHFDTQQYTTTAGTLQDTDTRWYKCYKSGCDMLVQAITYLSEKVPSIEVVVVPGNHDQLTCMTAGYYLEAWFRNQPAVKINNAAIPRKYAVYGKNLFGFIHGDGIKKDRLPVTMAEERKEDWANTTNRVWLTGHLHFEEMKEIQGVKVLTAPSLCATDAWHSSHLYVGNKRAAYGLLYHKNNGHKATFYYNVEEDYAKD